MDPSWERKPQTFSQKARGNKWKVIFATALVGGCQVETRQVEPEEAGGTHRDY